MEHKKKGTWNIYIVMDEYVEKPDKWLVKDLYLW